MVELVLSVMEVGFGGGIGEGSGGGTSISNGNFSAADVFST